MNAPAQPKTSANIASHLPAMARLDPARPAIISPDGKGGWRTMTFGELDTMSDRIAHGLAAIGVTRGKRTVLLVPPGPDFFPLVFGIFKTGAVMVAIDPGIGRKALLQCLEEVKPEAFIGIPAAHVARVLFPGPFRTVTANVTVGRRFLWGGHTLDEVKRLGRDEPFPMVEPAPNETAAILFTSGSTGIPKGVVYSHEIFDAQVRMIRDAYAIEPGEIDLPTFPLFALFDPALGMTAVLPEMDFRFPGKADPAKLVEALTTHRCTTMFGSPALVDNLGRYGEAKGVKLPLLKRVLSAGAPVRVDVMKRMTAMLGPDAQVFTPFGATESLPVASIGSREVLSETGALAMQGRGVCVGRPDPAMTVRIIRITDEPIPSWSSALEVPVGTIGEITVAGPVVTREYYARPEQTRAAKIVDGDRIVHRMGDVGSFDDQGRLWMCGRKSHRVETARGAMFSTPVEEVLNAHPQVRRSALVGVGAKGAQVPVVLLEREPGASMPEAQLVAEVKALAQQHESTKPVSHVHVYPGEFPVDRRHNAKIEREKLAVWAREKGLGR
ncbi:MAG: fatty acid CoA ligase family protein [Myxococcaceae bacterium]|nr:fatty acid CoA ligase family protein [Myxococcaceae bacterium]